MSDHPGPGRRFDDEEVARILERAAELEHRAPLAPPEISGMTLAQLEQVAAEAGIDPQHVRDAAVALERETRTPALPGASLLGAPMRLELERTVEGEIPAGAYEALPETIRATIPNPGYVSTLGKSFEWNSANPQRALRVTVTPRAGRTVIRIEERFGNLVGGLFGGIVGGVGGGGGGTAMGVIGGALHNIPAAVAAAGVALVGSFLLTRTIFRKVVRYRSAELHRLLDALAEQAAAR
jgi:hypothetical protein